MNLKPEEISSVIKEQIKRKLQSLREKTDWHEHRGSKQSAGAAEHGNGGTDRCKHYIDQRNQ